MLQLNCSFAPPPLTNYSNIARSVRVKSLSSPHCAHTMRFNTVSFQEFHYDFLIFNKEYQCQEYQAELHMKNFINFW